MVVQFKFDLNFPNFHIYSFYVECDSFPSKEDICQLLQKLALEERRECYKDPAAGPYLGYHTKCLEILEHEVWPTDYSKFFIGNRLGIYTLEVYKLSNEQSK